jgi:hypothetical protein
VPGSKANALILAPVSRDPTEGDGIKKKLTDRKKRNRAIQIVFFGYEFIVNSSGTPIKSQYLYI